MYRICKFKQWDFSLRRNVVIFPTDLTLTGGEFNRVKGYSTTESRKAILFMDKLTAVLTPPDPAAVATPLHRYNYFSGET